MPTRILFWNIRDFAVNKINNPSFKLQKGSAISRNAASNQRLIHILSVIENVNPQIFILVENETTFTQRGELVTGNGWLGAQTLLNAIRQRTGNNDWMLIPPIITGPREGVSVYFRSTNRYFTGPNVWSGGINGISRIPSPVAPLAYPATRQVLLPNRENIPAGAQYNVGLSERLAAARVEYTLAPPSPPNTAKNYGTQRSPYMTTFTEVAGGGVSRNLTIFSVHSPASRQPAITYLQELADVNEIVNAQPGNEVRVIAGDFNINCLQTTNGYIFNPAYQDLINRGYSLTILPTANVPVPLNGYVGYFATHIKPARGAKYGSTAGNIQYYPGYDYIGGETGNYVAIDNIYVRYGAATATPIPTIINTVAGSPFSLYNAPNQYTPIGQIMTEDLTADAYGGGLNVPPQTAPLFQIGVQTRFRGWNNYGRIYSVSDHFALAIDV